MAIRQIFYSFHFDNDVMRVQLVRNMDVIEGNKEVTPQRWEQVKNSETPLLRSGLMIT